MTITVTEAMTVDVEGALGRELGVSPACFFSILAHGAPPPASSAPGPPSPPPHLQRRRCPLYGAHNSRSIGVAFSPRSHPMTAQYALCPPSLTPHHSLALAFADSHQPYLDGFSRRKSSSSRSKTKQEQGQAYPADAERQPVVGKLPPPAEGPFARQAYRQG